MVRIDPNRTLRNVAIAWAGLTLLVVASSVLAYLWRGASVFKLLFDIGPNSNPHVTLLSITVVWLLFGSAIGFRSVGTRDGAPRGLETLGDRPAVPQRRVAEQLVLDSDAGDFRLLAVVPIRW